VRLKSADPADHPLIDPNYWSDPTPRHVDQGLRLARESWPAEALALTCCVKCCLPVTRQRRRVVRLRLPHLQTDHHPVGTCRMGHATWPW